MPDIADLSALINRQTGGNSGNPENIWFHKVPRISGAAATGIVTGRAASLWTYDGVPAAGDIPTSAAIPDRTTQGAIPFTAATGGRDKWLIQAAISSLVAGQWILYDRLFHIGGLSGISTSAQTVQGSTPSPALTRNTGGDGNIAWYEMYANVGTTARTLTVTYTNQAGTGSQTTTINIGGTGFRELTRAQRIPLAAGDTGIRAIESVQLDASTGSVGDFGITIANPLAFIPVGSAGAGGWRDYTTGLPGIPALDPDACLSLLFIPSTNTAPEIWGCLATIED